MMRRKLPEIPAFAWMTIKFQLPKLHVIPAKAGISCRLARVWQGASPLLFRGGVGGGASRRNARRMGPTPLRLGIKDAKSRCLSPKGVGF